MAAERKQVPVSNIERDFILQALREDKRIDGNETITLYLFANIFRILFIDFKHLLIGYMLVLGRRPFDFRTMKISFGPERGNTEVQLGNNFIKFY